jgi:hypothetical protein
MKRISFLLLVTALILTLSMPGAVMADNGSPTWNSIIYYFNPLARDGSMGVTFTGTGTGTPPVDQSDIPVKANGFGFVAVGGTGDFKGAAMLSADVPLVAVYKQFVDPSGGAYAPVLYSSFDATQSSVNGEFYIPSIVHAGYYVSKVGIQNVEDDPINLTLHFFDANGVEQLTLPKSIAGRGSLIFQLTDDDFSSLGSSFDGSLVIETEKTSGGSWARVVAAVEDLQAQGQRSYAYEGSGATANTVYLPYANCRYSTNQQSTAFYVQNAGTADATINIYYYTTGGAGITYYTPAALVKSGARMLVSACDPKVYAKMNGKNGTARITSDQPIVVVGKVSSTDGLSTAFSGQPSVQTSSNGYEVLLPYVVYSKLSSGPRATISIMNVGASPAKKVSINYWYEKTDCNFAAQTVVIASSSAPLAKFGKYSATPKVSGTALLGIDCPINPKGNSNGNYQGAATVTSDQPVVVVVRVSQGVTGVPGITTLGEDYTGVPFATGP